MSGIFSVKFTCIKAKGGEATVEVHTRAQNEKGALRAALMEVGHGKEESKLAKFSNRIASVTIEKIGDTPKGVLSVTEAGPKRPRKAKEDGTPEEEAPAATE